MTPPPAPTSQLVHWSVGGTGGRLGGGLGGGDGGGDGGGAMPWHAMRALTVHCLAFHRRLGMCRPTHRSPTNPR